MKNLKHLSIMRNDLKPGQIRVIPPDNRLNDMPPYINTQLNLPKWFRLIPREKGSLKTCAGVNDFLTIGMTVPAWSNFYFKPNLETQFWESRVDDMSPPFGNHGLNVMEGFPFKSTGECPVTKVRELDNFQYPKLVNPWKFQTAPGWSTLLLPVYWEPNPNYEVLPAMIHTDFYPTINCVINIKTSNEFKIPYGTPLMQLVPFKRSGNFEELVHEDESQYKYFASGGLGIGNIKPSDTGTAGPYRRTKHKLDSNDENKDEKNTIFRRISEFLKL